jgi:hypothetical protein
MIKIETGCKTIFRFDNVLDKSTCDKLYSEVIKKKNNNPVSNLPWHNDECVNIFGLDEHLQKLSIDHINNVTNLVNKQFKSVFGELKPVFTNLVLWSPGRYMQRHKDDGYSEIDKDLRVRKISSVTYLNDDFDGGETFIKNETGQFYISKPKLGSLVFYLSSGENAHGVNEVKNKPRATFPIWFGCVDNETGCGIN